MKSTSPYFLFLKEQNSINSSFVKPSISASAIASSKYITHPSETKSQSVFVATASKTVSGQNNYNSSPLENIAKWFLHKSSLSNKKLQKLCYYAYCWFIVFFNDKEAISKDREHEINSLCSDSFQAWIHGPVSPRLYHRYKTYGWGNIPQEKNKPEVAAEIESLLEQVWSAYGHYSADALEMISHKEKPWLNARKGYHMGDACANEISKFDIFEYYSSLG